MGGWIRALGTVRTECDTSHVKAEAAQQDYLAQTRAFSSRSKQLIILSWMLQERQILLCLQEMGLEVREVMLVEEQAHGIHPHDGRDLSVELEGIHACVDGIGGERGVEAGQLMQLVMEISNALADLGMLPIQDIPQLSKSAQEALTVVGLFLERLREAHASDTGLWD
jgi:hypothetical protein